MAVTVAKFCKGCNITVIRSVFYSKQRVVIRTKRPFRPQSVFPLGWHSDTRWRGGLANPQLLRTCCKREKSIPLPLIEHRSFSQWRCYWIDWANQCMLYRHVLLV